MTPKPLLRKFLPSEKRTYEQVWEHYSIERDLADQLRQSSPEQRQHLYSEVYEELFRRVPHHSQLTREDDAVSKQQHLGWQISLLRRFLRSNHVFLEVGGGDCALSIAVAPLVAKSVGCDVALSLSSRTTKPDNFQFLKTNGRSFDLDDESVDVVYSNQLMEHLHVDDARAQLVDIFRVLRTGGRYVCITPNRFGGPWDISMYFDRVATGFHMKEYTVKELAEIFRNIGFWKVHLYGGGKGVFCRIPVWLVVAFETLLKRIPARFATSISLSMPGRFLLGIRIVGLK